MTYASTLKYLYEQLPMFHRIGPAAYKADLSNTHAICKLLKHPEKKIRCIHVAGTNGKGSSSHMLAAILQQCGYKTGLYTSPHLVDFRERIRVNGKMISQKFVKEFVVQHKGSFEKIKPSFFEWTVGLAFDYFVKEKVDIAVIETGLGGRLDSTNVITPLVSLITNIGYDHTNLLGDTLEKIAAEKAGIIKPRVPVVIGERQQEIESVFQRKAKKEHAPVFFAGDEYISFFHLLKKEKAEICVVKRSSGEFDVFPMDLSGKYQMKNLSGVLQTIDVLQKLPVKRTGKKFVIERHQLKKALSSVKKLTGLRGRFEFLKAKPLVVCDTGHNAEGIKEVLEMLEKIRYKKLHVVFGVVNDKDPSKVLQLLPKKNALYYFTKANLPRSLNEQELKKLSAKHGLKGKSYPTVKMACEAAEKAAGAKDLVFIGGSTFVVADALTSLYK